MLKRASVISGQYGFTSHKMDRNLTHFANILKQFDCGATFPITAVTLSRNIEGIKQYQNRNIEFAVHGFFHVDHTRLSTDVQIRHLDRSRRLFETHNVDLSGFRCPYLRWNENTIAAVKKSKFLYDSSQAIAWDVVDEMETDAYRRALNFYGALSATTNPSLPYLEFGLVRIPYCLPDDEALVDRFQLKNSESMSKPWLTILEESYQLGELFALGLHPERIYPCESALRETLAKARQFTPGIWIARLDEVAHWWKSRAETQVSISTGGKGEFNVRVRGPDGLTILLRNVEATSSVVAWDTVYQRAVGTEVSLQSSRRPFIGVSPSSASNLKSFLRQQGFIIEEVQDDQTNTFYLDRREFNKQDERPLLALIEQGDFPLVRLGRWPDGARSALVITGDIDALTFWDYSLRFLGR